MSMLKSGPEKTTRVCCIISSPHGDETGPSISPGLVFIQRTQDLRICVVPFKSAGLKTERATILRKKSNDCLLNTQQLLRLKRFGMSLISYSRNAVITSYFKDFSCWVFQLELCLMTRIPEKVWTYWILLLLLIIIFIAVVVSHIYINVFKSAI